MSLDLVVLAAGIGSRYGGLKQLDGIGPSGEVIIDYSLYDAMQAGFDRIVFIIRREFEDAFKKRFGSGLGKDIEKTYVFQELSMLPDGFSVPPDRVKPWGTAHALLLCRDAVRGPFGVINADDFYGRESYGVLAGFLRGVVSGNATFSLVGFRLGNTLSEHGSVARGVCQVDRDGFLETVVERTSIEKDGGNAQFKDENGDRQMLGGEVPVSMNMWGFTPAIFPHLAENFPAFLGEAAGNPKAEYLIPSMVDLAIRKKKASVKVLKTSAQWFGITYKEDKQTVVENTKKLVEDGAYPADVRF